MANEEYMVHVANAEKHLGLPKDFVFKLLEEDDDWTFLIKVAFLAEGALVHANSVQIGKEEIRETLSWIGPEANAKLSKSLDVTDKETRTFIRIITALRNRLIHNIENHGFSFESYLDNEESAKDFLKSLRPYTIPIIQLGNQSVERDTFIKENPRFAVLFALFNLFGLYWVQVERKNLELREALLRRLSLQKN